MSPWGPAVLRTIITQASGFGGCKCRTLQLALQSSIPSRPILRYSIESWIGRISVLSFDAVPHLLLKVPWRWLCLAGAQYYEANPTDETFNALGGRLKYFKNNSNKSNILCWEKDEKEEAIQYLNIRDKLKRGFSKRKQREPEYNIYIYIAEILIGQTYRTLCH